MDRKALEGRIRTAVLISIRKTTGELYVPGAASNRHVHLSRRDLDNLFGPGYELTILKNITQPGQYAAKETVTIEGPKGKIEKVRVLGPVRSSTQVEISITDSFKLGIKPCLRMSGELSGTPGAAIASERGRIQISEGVIVAARHLHMSAEQARIYGLIDKQVVSLRTTGERAVVFENVVVRSGDGHEMEFHLDTDEANAAGLRNGDVLEVIR